MQELRFSSWPASPLPLAGLLAHRTCRAIPYMPSGILRVNDMLLSTIGFRRRVSHCPRGLYSLPLPLYAGISYAPTRRTLVIQRLARFQLIPNRLSVWRMVSMLTGRAIQPRRTHCLTSKSSVHRLLWKPKSRCGGRFPLGQRPTGSGCDGAQRHSSNAARQRATAVPLRKGRGQKCVLSWV
jgi:hypothetical protein